MSDRTDDIDQTHSNDIEDTPSVTCSRCDREWDLSYELDDLEVGNQSFEQFALDHMRHTGHFPDGISPWIVSCRHCPEEEEFLAASAAQRWSKTHARHTRHSIEVTHADEETTVVSPE
ncbi:hypothetical protein GL213_01620 [Halogeometricum borinquense]|uniref:Uncharacterized protein n=1 Tax=Halogeometricum borinquense TaxID=60847 RepID=A0A6C0UL89_9EURY|nr:hypothetical protein [Halogeometricum borinquense]QIB76214.1 hypothetical protein G3I44_19250 [Halogeometricum borinquense]QIQ75348.1 hypothetical protein GL213_01620 [Halogeometricum borinquense]